MTQKDLLTIADNLSNKNTIYYRYLNQIDSIQNANDFIMLKFSSFFSQIKRNERTTSFEPDDNIQDLMEETNDESKIINIQTLPAISSSSSYKRGIFSSKISKQNKNFSYIKSDSDFDEKNNKY